MTAEELRVFLDYCPDTGVFRWRVSGGGMRAGDVAGGRHPHGYVMINVRGGRFLAHRMAILFVTGEWPHEHVDHLNGIPNDNRISNLRCVSRELNNQNQRRAHSDSISGLLGVSWAPHVKRWYARIWVEGHHHHLGYFDTKESAHDAYVSAKRLLHSGNTL